jgi:integrase
MRGSSKSLPKYAYHKASGQAVVRLSGKDFYLGPHGTKASKIEYDRLIGEWLANGRQLSDGASDTPITVTSLCARYLKYCLGYYVKNGSVTDEVASVKIAIRHIQRKYAKTFAKDFGPLSLEVVREQMIDEGNSRRYINGNIGRIKRMFKWAVSKELIPVTTYQALATVTGLKKGKSEAVDHPHVLPVPPEVVEATIKHAKPIIADMIRFQMLTGCRPGEVTSIKPCEIDRRQKIWRYRPGCHKMEHKGRDRIILIGPQAQEILLPYLLGDENQTCFTRPTGGRHKRWNYSDKINQACDKAFPAPEGTKGKELTAWRIEHRWAPNRLRHSRATEIRERYGLEAAQAVLGHSQADVTQIYAERDIEKAARIMAEVG